MSGAVRSLAAQQEKRRRRLLLDAMLTSCSPQACPERQHAQQHDAVRKGIPSKAYTKGGTAEQNAAPSQPIVMPISARRAMAMAQRLHPTAMFMLRRGLYGNVIPGPTRAMRPRRWGKPLPWGFQAQPSRDTITASTDFRKDRQVDMAVPPPETRQPIESAPAHRRDEPGEQDARVGLHFITTASVAPGTIRSQGMRSYSNKHDDNSHLGIAMSPDRGNLSTNKALDWLPQQQPWQPPTNVAAAAAAVATASMLGRLFPPAGPSAASSSVAKSEVPSSSSSPADRRATTGTSPQATLAERMRLRDVCYIKLKCVVTALDSQQRQQWEPEVWKGHREDNDNCVLNHVRQLLLAEARGGRSEDPPNAVQRGVNILRRLQDATLADGRRLATHMQRHGFTGMWQVVDFFDRLRVHDLGEAIKELQPQLARELQELEDDLTCSMTARGKLQGRMFTLSGVVAQWYSLMDNAERDEAISRQRAAAVGQARTNQSLATAHMEVLRCAALGSFWMAHTAVADSELLDPPSCALLGPLYPLLVAEKMLEEMRRPEGATPSYRNIATSAASLYDIICWGPTSPIGADGYTNTLPRVQASPRFSPDHVDFVLCHMREDPGGVLMFTELCKAVSRAKSEPQFWGELARDCLWFTTLHELNQSHASQCHHGSGTVEPRGPSTSGDDINGSNLSAQSSQCDVGYHQEHRQQQQQGERQPGKKVQDYDQGDGRLEQIPEGEQLSRTDQHRTAFTSSNAGREDVVDDEEPHEAGFGGKGAGVGVQSDPAQGAADGAATFYLNDGEECVPWHMYEGLWRPRCGTGPCEVIQASAYVSRWVHAMRKFGLLDVECGDAAVQRQLLDVLRDAVAWVNAANSGYDVVSWLRDAGQRIRRRRFLTGQKRLQWLQLRPVEHTMMREVMQHCGRTERKTDVVEVLRPGLLAAHPKTWGRLFRLVEEVEQAAEGPEDCSRLLHGNDLDVVAQLAVFGLITLAGQDLPLQELRLSYCMATGAYLDVVLAGTVSDPAISTEEGVVAAEAEAVDFFFFLSLVPSLRTVPPDEEWTRESEPLQLAARELPEAPPPGLARSDPVVQSYMSDLLIHSIDVFYEQNELGGAITDCMGLARRNPQAARRGNRTYDMLVGYVGVLAIHPCVDDRALDEARIIDEELSGGTVIWDGRGPPA
ncbi:hypothetical protein Vretimale_2584 [Volvox reticuliferus]|uniref:Uncharacterized protein n=1 Tax=Volvox reticuliferus TaxID=1737510 RepID=A0A8J4D7X8_9CHLO|nr:hypothetical protein Vretifemale_4827 [Volvox reticuliferus]GIL96793.1 hypothetical protein Vretimale_2584 [Volvox reticuliferus]